MRELTSYIVDGANEALVVRAMDEPGPGGACHHYRVRGIAPDGGEAFPAMDIRFQSGPIREVGVNGISDEALLAIAEDRLLCFQSGEYASYENLQALHHVGAALGWFQKRTRDRVARGVEGTSEK